MTVLISHIVCEGASLARAQRGRLLVAGLTALLCLADLGFIDTRAIAQQFAGMYRWRTAMGPAVLTLEEERVKAAKPGSEFRECSSGCPIMVVIPAGRFIMGSPEDESDRQTSEGPQHEVALARPFTVSKFEVTFEEWDACVAAAGCQPVTNCDGAAAHGISNTRRSLDR